MGIACFLLVLGVFGVFYAVGFGLLGYGLWSAWRSTQAASWPTAPATITHLEFRDNIDHEGSTFEVKVQYTYTVEGGTYDGSRVAFGYAGSSGREAHEEIYTKLREAKAVAVRYNPRDPSMSCLSFGVHRSIQITLVMAVAYLVFLIGFTMVIWLVARSDRVLLGNLSVQLDITIDGFSLTTR